MKSKNKNQSEDLHESEVEAPLDLSFESTNSKRGRPAVPN